MNDATSSWWVPLGAAAVALAGVIIGQILGALTESHRHRRETKQRTFEHWRDKRFEAYSAFLELAEAWVDTARFFYIISNERASLKSSKKENDEHKAAVEFANQQYDAHCDSLNDIDENIKRSISSLRLVSSNHWYGKVLEIQSQIIQEQASILATKIRQAAKDSSQAVLDDSQFSEKQKDLNLIYANLLFLRDLARDEFGIKN